MNITSHASVTMKIYSCFHGNIRSSPLSYIDGRHRDQRYFWFYLVLYTCPNKQISETSSQKVDWYQHSGLHRFWQKANTQRSIPHPKLSLTLFVSSRRAKGPLCRPGYASYQHSFLTSFAPKTSHAPFWSGAIEIPRLFVANSFHWCSAGYKCTEKQNTSYLN